MQTTLAARYLGAQKLVPMEIPAPPIGPGEALLKVEACGFCGSDLEPLAVAVHGVSRVSLAGVKTVAVIGAGPIGLLTALALRSLGITDIYISDILAWRRTLAEQLGFVAVDPSGLHQLLQLATDNEGADVLFECA